MHSSELGASGYRSTVCSQIVLTCLDWDRRGRVDKSREQIVACGRVKWSDKRSFGLLHSSRCEIKQHFG